MKTKVTMGICGHIQTRAMLDRIAQSSIHPQSFLFFGPKYLGKALVAREFALKLTGTTVPSSGFHPDILTIGGDETESSEEKKSLSVEEIREAQAFLSRFPESGRYRVVIIDSAERLTHAAENALLKLLEEPNTSSIVILVCSRPAKLLATVRSRLFPVSFSLVSPEILHQSFPEANLPDFFFSLGLPGLLKGATDNPLAFNEMKEQLKKLFQISRLSWSERIALADTLSKSPEELENMLNIWLIGLARRHDNSPVERTRGEAAFLESVIETIDRLGERQGTPRLLMEKLFTAL